MFNHVNRVKLYSLTRPKLDYIIDVKFVISILIHNNIIVKNPSKKETHPISLFVFSSLSLVFFLHLNHVEICLDQLDILTVAFTEYCVRPS